MAVVQEGPAAMTFAKNLHRWRSKRGYSMQDLAELSGVAKSHISRIEAGQCSPTLARAAQLSKALAVSLAKMV